MKIRSSIQDSISLKESLLTEDGLIEKLETIITKILTCFNNDGKVLWCGNGGSAADAQHLSAELSGRFYMDRAALDSEALHVNSSYLTAVGNDYGFDDIYVRALGAKAKKGDVLIAMSTSGQSANILKAIEKAKSLNLTVVFLTGKSGSSHADKCDYHISIPSDDTARIQECHMLLGHIICAEVEAQYFSN